MNDLVTIEKVENRIYTIRGQKVMLDSDLAALYGVLTKNLNKAVKRNIEKFPPEFMFQLSDKELEDLRFQIGTTKLSTKKRFNPYVFTEHGVLMTANILNSEKANIISVQIVKAFIKLRDYAISYVGLNEQIAELRKLLMLHIETTENRFCEHEEAIKQIITALNNLISCPQEQKKIGF